jgi:hypothetical protein
MIDTLTSLVMQVCDCKSCQESGMPCEKVKRVTEQIRRTPIKINAYATYHKSGCAYFTGGLCNCGVFSYRP